MYMNIFKTDALACKPIAIRPPCEFRVSKNAVDNRLKIEKKLLSYHRYL